MLGFMSPNINNIDLLDDQFSIEMLLWTEWAGDPATNPSDDLMVLNGIYDGDIQRFERVSRENRRDTTWSLYRVRSSVVKHWRLQRYPFRYTDSPCQYWVRESIATRQSWLNPRE
jgi:hypothetical protein